MPPKRKTGEVINVSGTVRIVKNISVEANLSESLERIPREYVDMSVMMIPVFC
jgi:hypothetical protein